MITLVILMKWYFVMFHEEKFLYTSCFKFLLKEKCDPMYIYCDGEVELHLW